MTRMTRGEIILERWIVERKDRLHLSGRNGEDMFVSGRDPSWPRAYKSEESADNYYPDFSLKRVTLVDADWLDRLLISCERQFLDDLNREKCEDRR